MKDMEWNNSVIGLYCNLSVIKNATEDFTVQEFKDIVQEIRAVQFSKEKKIIMLNENGEMLREKIKNVDFWKDVKKYEMRKDNKVAIRDVLVFEIDVFWKETAKTHQCSLYEIKLKKYSTEILRFILIEDLISSYYSMVEWYLKELNQDEFKSINVYRCYTDYNYLVKKEMEEPTS